MRFRRRVTWLVLASCALLAGPFEEARSAPKEVDGVTLIDQKGALAGSVTPGDAPGFPVEIRQPGSYRLASDLTVTDPTKHGILILAGPVTLDLNGFTIKGAGPGSCILPDENCGWGIRSDNFPTVIMNGTVRDFWGHGIVMTGSLGRIERVQVVANGLVGIETGRGTIISGCSINNNAYGGIFAGDRGIITGNVVAENGQVGIHIWLPQSDGATVTDNTITANRGYGIEGDHNGWGGYARNVLNRNNNSGAQVRGGVQMGGNVCGGVLCP